MNSYNNLFLGLKLCSPLCITILNLAKPLWSINAYWVTVQSLCTKIRMYFKQLNGTCRGRNTSY